MTDLYRMMESKEQEIKRLPVDFRVRGSLKMTKVRTDGKEGKDSNFLVLILPGSSFSGKIFRKLFYM